MSAYNPQDADSHANGLATSAHELAMHAEELLHSTAAISGESLSQLRTRLTDSLHSARAQIENVQQQTMLRGRKAATATDVWVKTNPWQAVAGATLIGLAIGFMSRRARPAVSV